MSVVFSDQVVLVSDLRKNLSYYLDKARAGTPISIMQGNRADVVLVGRDEMARLLNLVDRLESWVETLEILADSETMDDLRRSADDIAAGRYVALDQLRAEWGVE
jgi:prevent-host-death family protein